MSETVRENKDRKGADRMPEPLPEEYLRHTVSRQVPDI